MALQKCDECGKDVSSKAQSCPNCGAPVSNEEVSHSEVEQTKKGVGYIRYFFFGGIIGLMIFMVLFGLWMKSINSINEVDPNAWKTGDRSTMAYIMMKDFVKEKLKSPSTAVFPSDSYKLHVKPLPNQTYEISSYVDSQNSFGALIRTKFHGRVRKVSSSKWALISLEFE